MRRIIIDTDTASDDAVALLYALLVPEVRVEAITVVAGNLPLSLCVKNALVSVETAGTYAPPVYSGAPGPLLRRLFTSEFVHGSDGMGGMDLPEPSARPEKAHAVDAIIGLARLNPGELDLVTLGPLTNLALAVKLEPELPRLLRSVWVMGGTGHGPGNVAPAAEFNLFVDAEAAQIVIDSGLRPTFVGWDVSTDETFLGPADMERLAQGSAAARFSLRCNRDLVKFNERAWGGKRGFDLPDPVAMIAALHPELIVERYDAYCAMSWKDETTYGQLVIDRGRTLGREPNASIVTKIDARAFKDRLFGVLGA